MAKLYVAYGSNLNKNQMRSRCPGAKFVGTGVIENYELQFKGSLHGAHATIAPKEGAFVPVGVWTIQKRDESYLDKDTENRIARVLFKQSVELAMLMHVVAATHSVRPEDLEALRKMCVGEVSKVNGRFHFDDAVRLQNR